MTFIVIFGCIEAMIKKLPDKSSREKWSKDINTKIAPFKISRESILFIKIKLSRKYKGRP